MSWWSLDWLPTLPSFDFALPSSIQKRFISFVLRRSLGRFLKPGQLDAQQVDSQIGAGYVQVRDLELDNDAINAFIAGLPLKLHDGSLEKATVRIPLPNPLTSTIGLSLESLHLTFYLTPEVTVQESPVDLAESVASVAETFIHEELSPDEEAALRESFHPDMSDIDYSIDEHLPGGLNPFMQDINTTSPESEPQGVPIFATLIERLLARFQFDANDVKITLVNPGQASFTFAVDTVAYKTDGVDNEPLNATSSKCEVNAGEVRTVTVSGVTVSTRDLRPLSPAVLSPAMSAEADVIAASPTLSARTVSPHPPSPQSDTSEFDEATQMLMSQSIAALPARPQSPASTVASSMYESAVSNAPFAEAGISSSGGALRNASSSDVGDPPDINHPFTLPPAASARDRSATSSTSAEIEDEPLVSFGSDPISLRLTTPPLMTSMAFTPSSSRLAASRRPSSAAGSDRQSGQQTLNSGKVALDASAGVIACSLRARHVRAILDVADTWGSHVPASSGSMHSSPSAISSGPKWLEKAEARLHVRSFVVVLLPSLDPRHKQHSDLSSFYLHPLIPPKLSYGYVRLHFEKLSMAATLPGHTSSMLPNAARHMRSSAQSSTSLDVSALISELSACAFVIAEASPTASQSESSSLHVVPLLVTDPNLSLQYPSEEQHHDLSETMSPILPGFEIVDWTNRSRQTAAAKLSLWRTKPQPHAQSPPIRSGPSPVVLGLSPRMPVGSPTSTRSPFARSSYSPGKSDASAKPHISAVAIKGHIPLGSSRKDDSFKVEVDVVPLHIFVDLGLALASNGRGRKSNFLSFVEEVMGPAAQDTSMVDDTAKTDEEIMEDTEAQTPASTPRARRFRDLPPMEMEQERERQRLERLVIEDLDLEFDYRYEGASREAEAIPTQVPPRTRQKLPAPSAKHGDSKVLVNFSVIRIEIRAPAPRMREPRSGALILDLHDLTLSPGSTPQDRHVHSTRFAEGSHSGRYPNERSQDQAGDVLLSISFRRLLLAASLVGEERATSILSVSSLSVDEADGSSTDLGAGSPVDRSERRPKIQLTQSAPHERPGGNSGLTSTAVLLDVPTVYAELTKPILDAVQLWADDVSKLLDAVSSEGQRSHLDSSASNSRDTSLIGSRYFARTREGSQASGSELGAQHSDSTTTRSETAVKLSIATATVRLYLPRHAEAAATRLLDIAVSDIDVLLELRPEGNDETVVTVGVDDILVKETLQFGATRTFLGLTLPHVSSHTSRPALKLRFTSLVVPETTAKESRVRLTLCGLTLTFFPEIDWFDDMSNFAKAPPGVFDSVVPNETTSLSIKVVDTSLRLLAPDYAGALVPFIGELSFTTTLVGDSAETMFQLHVPSLSLFLTDDLSTVSEDPTSMRAIQASTSTACAQYWKVSGFALLAELKAADIKVGRFETYQPPHTHVTVANCDLRLHLCADTLTTLTAFIGRFSSIFAIPDEESQPVAQKRAPRELYDMSGGSQGLTHSVDEQAFRTLPEIGAAPDMIRDDLPTNLDYLDESFGAAAGLRELDDEDLYDLDFESPEVIRESYTGKNVNVTRYGGETIKMLRPEGLHIVQSFYDTMTPDATEGTTRPEETTLQIYVQDSNAILFLYEGYDWARTRSIIEEERKQMRRKLAKIRQLVANGQTPDPSVEETNTLLFNSVYIGLEHNIDDLEPGALIAAIDEELDNDSETASQSSWQSLKQQVAPAPAPSHGGAHSSRSSRQRMTRSKGPSIEFRFEGLIVEVDRYKPDVDLVSRTLVTVKDVEILDHVKTSTWRKFLTALYRDTRGNVRETDSNMVRFELKSLHPVPNHPSEEARLRAKILPLRLHVDQDALDFLKKFFSFKDPDALPAVSPNSSDEIYFQQAEVFPVGIKLDYKPRRVDYRALRDGKTIELMNFFHFDEAEMTLRHITLTGITGWPRFFDLLNDLWTPDVKATQLVDVISGVAPIRSVVNVGSGVADLVLLPIAQYKKDGRVVRGLQKGATAFVKSTAMEAIKLGAKLATGTQVILEQAETVLGGQGSGVVTAEAVQTSPLLGGDMEDLLLDDDDEELISRYADQPTNVHEGIRTAYKSLRTNLSSAAQTILAVPMEVYERSGNEGAVRAVVRAVPIAVLKPMIGASEAVSKTLLGLHNTMDPNARLENEAKYKRR